MNRILDPSPSTRSGGRTAPSRSASRSVTSTSSSAAWSRTPPRTQPQSSRHDSACRGLRISRTLGHSTRCRSTLRFCTSGSTSTGCTVCSARRASAIIMNTPEAEARVRHRLPDLAPKLADAITNGWDADDFVAPPPLRNPDVFRIVHAGFLHTASGYELRRSRRRRRLLGGMPYPGVDFLPRSHVFLLEAIDRLLAESPELAARIEVQLAGVTSPIDREIAERSAVCRLPGYLAHDKTVELLRSADLLFLPMHDLPPGTRAGLVPGKAYDYLGGAAPNPRGGPGRRRARHPGCGRERHSVSPRRRRVPGAGDPGRDRPLGAPALSASRRSRRCERGTSASSSVVGSQRRSTPF